MKLIEEILEPIDFAISEIEEGFRGLFVRKNATFSADGKYYYIEDDGASGWLAVDSDDWLPFVFWKVKSGEKRRATKEEVRRYEKAQSFI